MVQAIGTLLVHQTTNKHLVSFYNCIIDRVYVYASLCYNMTRSHEHLVELPPQFFLKETMEQKLPSIAPNILKQMEGYTKTYKAVSQELTKQGHYTRNQRRRGGDQTTDNLANSLQTSEKQD